MPREKTPVAFSRTGFDRPAINPALDYMFGDPPERDEPSPASSPEPSAPDAVVAPAPPRSETGEGRETPEGEATSARERPPASPRAAARGRRGPEPLARRATAPASEPGTRRTTTRVTLDVDAELWDRFKDAIVARGLTLSGQVEDAVERRLAALERENGGPFPQRATDRLRAGRRVR